MKARKFVLIYFKTVKAKKSTEDKKSTVRKKVNTRLKKMSLRQNKAKHGRKKKKLIANSLGAGYVIYI